MWVLAEHSIASDTDDIPVTGSRPLLDTEKAPTWVTAVSRVCVCVCVAKKPTCAPKSLSG